MRRRGSRRISSAAPAVAMGALGPAFLYRRQLPHGLRKLQLPVVTINPAGSLTDSAWTKRHGFDVTNMPGVDHFLRMEDMGQARIGRLGREALLRRVVALLGWRRQLRPWR